jgi:phenylpyruvate tautomerase PptA (4-oxalocrotonate tautomerase family)
MPLLKVEIVDTPGWVCPRELARRIADAAAEALGAMPQSVWVRLSVLPAEAYAENGGAPDDTAPVFVTILEKSPPEGEVLAAEVAALTNALAAACGRTPSDIHLVYEPPGRDRVAFGGRLVT